MLKGLRSYLIQKRLHYKEKLDIGSRRPKQLKKRRVQKSNVYEHHQHSGYGHNENIKRRNYKKGPLMRKKNNPNNHAKVMKTKQIELEPGHLSPKQKEIKDYENKPHPQSYGSDEHKHGDDLYGDLHSYEDKIDYGDSLEYMNISYTRKKSVC